jgi:hypothetical protein
VKIAGVIHDNIHLTYISTFRDYRPPILFLRYIKSKGMCVGTDLVNRFVPRLEVGGNHFCSSFCQRQGYRLADTLGCARYPGKPSLVRFYRRSHLDVCGSLSKTDKRRQSGHRGQR